MYCGLRTVDTVTVNTVETVDSMNLVGNIFCLQNTVKSFKLEQAGANKKND